MGQYDWLAKVPSNSVFIAFDTETTGLNPKQNNVIEIGALKFDGKGIFSRFSALINPNIPIPQEVTKINNITDNMVKGQPKAPEVFPDFLAFIQEDFLIAHNAPFDIDFVQEELNRLGLKRLNNRVIDTRILAKELYPGLPKYSLQELAKNFNITAKDAHRAEDDARVCMELFIILFKELKNKFGIIEEAIEFDAQQKKSDNTIHTNQLNFETELDDLEDDFFEEDTE